MANEVTNSGDIALPVNNVLMRGMLSAAVENYPYLNGALPGKLMKHEGTMTVKWRRLERLAAVTSALGEVNDQAYMDGRTPVKPVLTPITAVMAKYGNYHLLEEGIDFFEPSADNAAYVANLGENAGHSLNLGMRAVMAALTTNRFSNGTATTDVNTELSANDVAYAVDVLETNSAMKQFNISNGSTIVGSSPIETSFIGICHTHLKETIRGMTGFIDAYKYSSHTKLMPGEFGQVKSVRWVATNIAPLAAGGGAVGGSGVRETSTNADVYTTFIYGREATGSVGLEKEFKGEIYDGNSTPSPVEIIAKGPTGPYNETRTVAWKAWATWKILNSNWIMKLESAAPLLA